MSRLVIERKLRGRSLDWSLRCRGAVCRRGHQPWHSPSPSPLPPGARESWRQGGNAVATFDYDFSGNLVNKTDGLNTSTPTPTALSYDPLDQLVTASKTWEQPQSYQYDDQGRRISKSVGVKVTNYVYNGSDIIAENSGTWNKAVASYTHGGGTDQPLIRTTGAATPISQYYHQDGLGSITAVTDQTGATVGTARNDAWGNKLSGNGGLPQYGFTGREPDETGLVFYRGRYYDPTIGRFIQRDPIGMAGGMNLYAYVGNNPINFTDPMGTKVPDPANTNSATEEGNYVVVASCDVCLKPLIIPGLPSAVEAAVTVITPSIAIVGGIIGAVILGTPTDVGVGSDIVPQVLERGNRVEPDAGADGPHTGFKTDESGKVTGYTEFDAFGNPVKRFKGEGRPHGGQEPPLILEPKAGKGPGAQPKVPRPPRPDELPKGYK